MLPHDTPSPAPTPREVREERARAFWQAQINEGRARAAEQQSRTNKQAGPLLEPPPSPAPPTRVPLHVASAETEFTDTAPPITPADIPALFLAAASVLRLQCRHVRRTPLLGCPTGQRPGRLEARTDRSPAFDPIRPLKR